MAETMNHSQPIRWGVLTCIALTLRLVAPALAAEGTPLTLTVGKSTTLPVTTSYRYHALSGDGKDLVDISHDRDTRQLRLVPKRVGATNLVILNQTGEQRIYTLSITAAREPAKQVKSALQQNPGTEEALTAARPAKSPKEQQIENAIKLPGVAVRVEGGTVILEGRVATQFEKDRADQVAQQHATIGVDNRLKVGTADTSPARPLVGGVPTLTISPTSPGAFGRQPVTTIQKMTITLGLAKIIETSTNILRMGFSNETVINATPVAPRHLVINGLKEGSASLYVFTERTLGDRVGAVKEYLVEVVAGEGQGATARLTPEVAKERIVKQINDPRITVEVDAGRDGKLIVALKGTVELEKDALFAEKVASFFTEHVNSNIRSTIPAIPPPVTESEALTRELQEYLGVETVRAQKVGNRIALIGELSLENLRSAQQYLAGRGQVLADRLKVQGAEQSNASLLPSKSQRYSDYDLLLMEGQLTDRDRRITERIRSLSGVSTFVVQRRGNRYFVLGRVRDMKEYDAVKGAIEVEAGFEPTQAGSASGGGGGGNYTGSGDPGGIVAATARRITQGQQAAQSAANAAGGAEGSDDDSAGGASGAYPFVNYLVIESGGVIRQVTIQANVIEISRTGTRDLGLQWGEQQIQQGGGGGTAQAVNPNPGTIAFIQNGAGGLVKSQVLVAQLKALQQRSQARLLSSPTTTVLDRGSSWIQVGGSFPISTVTSQGGSGTTQQSIQFIPFGVILVVRPVVTGDKVFLQVYADVSQPDFGQAVTFNGSRIPGLKQRKTQSTTMVGAGESLVIGGLIDSIDSKTVGGTPILRNIPILGSLFQSRGFQKGNTELAIILSPRIEEIPATSHDMNLAGRSHLPLNLPSVGGGVGGGGAGGGFGGGGGGGF